MSWLCNEQRRDGLLPYQLLAQRYGKRRKYLPCIFTATFPTASATSVPPSFLMQQPTSISQSNNNSSLKKERDYYLHEQKRIQCKRVYTYYKIMHRSKKSHRVMAHETGDLRHKFYDVFGSYVTHSVTCSIFRPFIFIIY